MRYAFHVGLLILMLVGSARSGVAQLAVVRGTITDSASGNPLVGAFIAALKSQRWGRERSGANGGYVLDRIPPGVTELEFHCPSATMLGWPIEVRPIRLRAGQDTVVDIRVSATTCGEPPYAERRGTFQGSFSVGFEHSSFAPCPDTTLGVPLLRPKGGWLVGTIWVQVDSATSRRLGESWPRVRPDSRGYLDYFVRWHGTLKGPGRYGHMGVAGYLMEVDTVYSVLIRNEGSC
jgi:hypothetical protein